MSVQEHGTHLTYKDWVFELKSAEKSHTPKITMDRNGVRIGCFSITSAAMDRLVEVWRQQNKSFVLQDLTPRQPLPGEIIQVPNGQTAKTMSELLAIRAQQYPFRDGNY